MHKILVSRCLLGELVRYDGGCHGPFNLLQRWQAQGRIVPICPEVAGGLSTPRPPAEIQGGQGAQVLTGNRQVLTHQGQDVSQAFIQGAQLALQLVQQHHIKIALLKARSPSCGNQHSYDGSFSGQLVDGQGVCAALLSQHGVLVFNEQQLEQAAATLAQLEAEQ